MLQAQRSHPSLPWGLSLEGDSVDGILLNIWVEIFVSHQFLHTSLAESVSVEDLEKFLELIFLSMLPIHNEDH